MTDITDMMNFSQGDLQVTDKIKGSKIYRGWNELKLSGKLPERRSYHIGCLNDGNLYIFGGQDIKEGLNNTLWKLNMKEVIESCLDQNDVCYA